MRTVDALKPLTAGKLLELWRYYRERVEDPLERTLLCNAAILRDSCYCQGEAIYGDELEVLRDLTPGEMEDLLLRLAEGEALPEPPAGSAKPSADRQSLQRGDHGGGGSSPPCCGGG